MTLPSTVSVILPKPPIPKVHIPVLPGRMSALISTAWAPGTRWGSSCPPDRRRSAYSSRPSASRHRTSTPGSPDRGSAHPTVSSGDGGTSSEGPGAYTTRHRPRSWARMPASGVTTAEGNTPPLPPPCTRGDAANSPMTATVDKVVGSNGSTPSLRTSTVPADTARRSRSRFALVRIGGRRRRGSPRAPTRAASRSRRRTLSLTDASGIRRSPGSWARWCGLPLPARRTRPSVGARWSGRRLSARSSGR